MMRYVITICLGLLAGIWEIAVRPILPPGFQIPMLLPMVVLTVISSKASRVIGIAIIATIFMSLYQVFTFDLIVFRWIGIVLITIFLARYWLTNRSVYSSMALGAIAQILDWGSHYLISRFGLLVTDFARGWELPYIWYTTLLWDLALIALGFFLLAKTTSRFQLSVQRQTDTLYISS